jgi:anti-sigma regulatory factor (Ser/Thr protein kinase)
MMLADAAPAETRSCLANADRISELDGWIERTGASWGMAEDVVFRARVCVAEAAANLLEHGRIRPEGDEITVTLKRIGTGLELEIRDTGRAFDPTAPVAGTASPGGLGGRGLRLIRAFSATMRYRRDGGHNILCLRVVPAQHNPGSGSPS